VRAFDQLSLRLSSVFLELLFSGEFGTGDFQCALLLKRSLDLNRQAAGVVGKDSDVRSGSREPDVPALMTEEMRLARVEVEHDSVGGSALHRVHGARAGVFPVLLRGQVYGVEFSAHEEIGGPRARIQGHDLTDVAVVEAEDLVISCPTDEVARRELPMIGLVDLDL
jgi:hypothetical protein